MTDQIAHHDGTEHAEGQEMTAAQYQNDAGPHADGSNAIGFAFAGLVAAILVAVLAGFIIYSYRNKKQRGEENKSSN